MGSWTYIGDNDPKILFVILGVTMTKVYDLIWQSMVSIECWNLIIFVDWVGILKLMTFPTVPTVQFTAYNC